MHLIKKFQQWFVIKENLESKPKLPPFKEGEIWWCNLGENVGHEECGKGDKFIRPVIVIRKFNSRLFYGIPTSSKSKNNPYYYDLKLKKNNTHALLSQMRIIDAKRLNNKMAKLSDPELILLKKKIARVIIGQ
jgi:mRNA interferase MazF